MIAALGIACMLLGVAFVLLAALGIVRLPDLLTRMHALSKASTLGVGLTTLSLLFFYQDVGVAMRAVGVVLFVAITAPVSAHMIGRAAYLSGTHLWEGTFVDELGTYRDRHAVEAAETWTDDGDE